ncbi:MAG: hypothetical protein ACHQ0Y_08820 [Thermodesulfovibrionales bacterium]
MMFDKKTLDKKVNRLAVFFMMFVAALFVISIASSASAYPFALQGKVASIDSGGKKLTLQEDQCGMSGQYGFTWDDRATVMRGNDFVSFSDIRVGDDVIVSYYEKSPGLYVAEDINIPDMLLPHC